MSEENSSRLVKRLDLNQVSKDLSEYGQVKLKAAAFSQSEERKARIHIEHVRANLIMSATNKIISAFFFCVILVCVVIAAFHYGKWEIFYYFATASLSASGGGLAGYGYAQRQHRPQNQNTNKESLLE